MPWGRDMLTPAGEGRAPEIPAPRATGNPARVRGGQVRVHKTAHRPGQPGSSRGPTPPPRWGPWERRGWRPGVCDERQQSCCQRALLGHTPWPWSLGESHCLWSQPVRRALRTGQWGAGGRCSAQGSTCQVGRSRSSVGLLLWGGRPSSPHFVVQGLGVG